MSILSHHTNGSQNSLRNCLITINISPQASLDY